ncbi:MAG: type I glyceraldehyde-3-phosphate dehydrogenase [Peptostreptococcaceae bacterium]|nr:type I glyceraldehyde-3-phosphate dehydrogenase [Peptostreptococcaceae bacterium]
MIKIGISGYGRISRVVIRAAMVMDDIQIVGINKRNADIEYMEYMLRYDSVFGRFDKELGRYDKGLIINGKKVPVYSESDASKIPWSECGAEYIMEGTGAYNTTEKAKAHLVAGAKKVIISAPAKDMGTPTFVYGVNHDEYITDYDVVSNASCTTNCLAPTCKVLNDFYGIEGGLMSTIHAATAKQAVVDMRSESDWRRGRSAFGNIIPSTTGAAKAVGLVIPDLQGKMTGISYRVPVADVSVVDLNVKLKKATTYKDICDKMKEASETYMKGVLEYVDDEVVSSDFLGDAHTSIFDAREGMEMNDKWFKLISFYDNEFGYSSKTLEMIRHMYKVDHQ